jgi:predicted aldo/keto reductase-like oxidoreductase
MATAEEVRADIKSASAPRPLDEEDRHTIDTLRKSLGAFYCRRCDYCQPCPNDIPIAFLLHMPSVRGRMGDRMMQTDSFRDILNKARNCDSCGSCEDRCPFDLPVREMLKRYTRLLEDILE